MLITRVFLVAAYSNMVLLLLTRGAEQVHELAVRRALGASRVALVRPFAPELLVLVAAGVLAALVVLRWVRPVVSTLLQLAPLGPAVPLDAESCSGCWRSRERLGWSSASERC